VLATTHAHWTARLTADRAWSAWAVAGSVAPDAPALVRAAWVLGGRRTSREDALGRIYHEPPWREIHLAAHAAWAPVVAAAVAGALGAGDARARALALGWAGHLAVDYVTHHDDAWPPGWPLTGARYRAPLSYWQADHHAAALLGADAALSLAAAVRRPTRLSVLALTMTGLALRRALGPGANAPMGLSADAAARARDLS
jgi:hypothetical protein